jgi:hypothetical protein
VRIAVALPIVAVIAAACGGNPTRPDNVQQPSGQYVLGEIKARVTDTALRVVSGVRVDVITESGTRSSRVSDGGGNVTFSGAFSGRLTFNAVKDGYVPTTLIVDANTICTGCGQLVRLVMESPNTIVKLQPGSYTLTFLADPACSRLPEELRTRTYNATLTRATNDFTGTFTVEVDRMSLGKNVFWLGISGDYLMTDDDSYPTLFEVVTPNTYLSIDFLIMTTDVQVANGRIAVTIPATFESCTVTPGTQPAFCDFVPPSNRLAHDRCFADHHQMILAPR